MTMMAHRGTILHRSRPTNSVAPTYSDTDTTWLLSLSDTNVLQWELLSQNEILMEWELSETPLITTRGSETCTLRCLNAQMLPKTWRNYNAFHDSYRRTEQNRVEYYKYTGDNPSTFTGYTSNTDFQQHSQHIVKTLADSYEVPTGSDWSRIVNVNIAGEIQLTDQQVAALNIGQSTEPLFSDLKLRVRHISEIHNGTVTYTFTTYYNSTFHAREYTSLYPIHFATGATVTKPKRMIQPIEEYPYPPITDMMALVYLEENVDIRCRDYITEAGSGLKLIPIAHVKTENTGTTEGMLSDMQPQVNLIFPQLHKSTRRIKLRIKNHLQQKGNFFVQSHLPSLNILIQIRF